MTSKTGPAGKIAAFFIDSKLTPLIIIASILLGIAAVMFLPREEEPQIIVPIIDVFVQMPGASAKEVEQRVTKPMEKLLWEIPGVEYIYSTSSPGMSMAVVRFLVGQDEEASIVRLQSKLTANYDRIPQGVSPPLIRPRYIDDVPILALTFWSDTVDHYQLRRMTAEIEDIVKQEPNVSITTIIGGEPRKINVRLDPARLEAYGLDAGQTARLISVANQASDSGSYPSENGQIVVHTGGLLKTAKEVGAVVINVANGRPVYLRDIATIEDGPADPGQYVFFGTGPAAHEKQIPEIEASKGVSPAVTLTVAKRKGTNAISVAHKVLERVNDAKGRIIPDNIHMTITRHYGETAKEKSDELLLHMVIAVISVIILIWFTLGRRESGVVAFAIPVTLALTLTTFYLYGYTLNRITLFALIFSIGILVDDAIVVVENVVRHYRLKENEDRSRFEVAIEAVDEVGNPTILATLAVIAAILPMAFVGGLMGPYMRPIPVGASAAMFFSLMVAFIVTPWASVRMIRHKKTSATQRPNDEDWSTRLYRKVMGPLLHHKAWQWGFLISVAGLLILACAMVGVGLVKVKILPFDNKSEFQVILDMPETATLEDTASAAMDMGDYLKTVNEVVDFQIYAGTAGPFNFNGLVRHYDLRGGPNMADIQVNLAGKGNRKQQSHEIAKRVRPAIKAIADRYGARVKIAEVPPGPPVLSTLVAEIYGPDYDRQKELALKVRDIFESTAGVVDVDWYMEENQTRYQLDIDQEKAALHGISVDRIAQTLQLVLEGQQVGLLHQPLEKEDVPIILQPALSDRAGIDRLSAVKLVAADGSLLSLSSLVNPRKTGLDTSIYHKNLMPVIYVTADVAGEKESPVYAILEMWKKINAITPSEGYKIVQHTASLPETDRHLSMKWDGEWHITYEVFRDLGFAFGVVLILIFVLVVGWFQSFSTPFVIMVAIPFSLIGILPAHWAMGAFFSATSMIGFIAGAGIVVRNSIILVDFIELRIAQGMPLDEAVVDAGAVRFRPMMLTAAAVVVGASVILFDPIFQGLAISLMAGEVASLLFSRMTVPILYFMDKRWEGDHLKHSERLKKKD
ncbi:MAG: efflux RND transporter permease subunit [Proteobacteria bacterium]|nr:efflux RND transporter permease subunit [Pseudomonadota bacterium]MBU1389784.1 efflux RND transporter permease subunit [Pseudomonadota bacterium]MBU1543793.1 efflux RND transporter permease subunit [Pseudomonadota bacterium]MBU2430126.1 efflux RND transporter permease subunit [Pseudomonadota bacterium]MBU2480717.1 efflux RND transporter permease subunit [Pseudomonadota bacterium]